ncbi:unnamed protein product [Trichobilharzia regenti]|nr:unnamed protein product [Trichobilharzia regenti]
MIYLFCNDNNSNNENIDVISLPDQDNLKLLTRTYEKILFDNTSNNSDGKASQDGESFLTDPNSSTDAVLIGFSKRKHDNVDEGKQTLPEEANKIEDLK